MSEAVANVTEVVVQQQIGRGVEISRLTEVLVQQRTNDKVEVVASGPPGPRGPSGEGKVGIYAVQITSPQAGDLLMFGDSSKWVNTPRKTITDGGNF